MDERSIRLLVAVEAPRDLGELLQRAVGMPIRRALFEIHRLIAARRLAAFEQYVSDLGDRGVGCNFLEAALAQHGRFERELRREAGAHLLFAACRAGLVVEDDITPVGHPLDAVGDAAQFECALVELNGNFATDLGIDARNRTAAFGVPAREPMRDAQEARPPEGARFRKIVQGREERLAERDEFAHRLGRQAFGIELGEIADGGVDDGAALGRAGRGVHHVERPQAQNVLGVDRIRIAQPMLDFGDREALRPRRPRRRGRGLRRRCDARRPIQFAREREIDFTAPGRRLPARAGDSSEPLDEARRHRRRAGDLRRMAQDHLAGAEQLREIMR